MAEVADRGDTTPVLQAVGLSRSFRVGGLWSRHGLLRATDDVSFAIGAGEIVGLVGESGSGKSTVARLLARVHTPSSGDVLFEGRSISALRSRADVLAYRGRVPMVFQDPFSSLNPAFRASHGVLRSLRLHRPELSPAARQAEAERVAAAVGLDPASLQRYPFELSGGQRQRVGFAQALASSPALILADEPVSMLDVSIRVGLLNLMIQLRDDRRLSLLYITHDLASARYVADRILVMYAGRVVESGPSEDVLSAPVHPYTELLLSAAPDPRVPIDVTESVDAVEPPRMIDPPPGCAFRARCPLATDRCAAAAPALVAVDRHHTAACHVRAPARERPAAMTPTGRKP